MAMLRWGALVALVSGVYVAFGMYEPAAPLVEQLAARRAAVAAEMAAALSATPTTVDTDVPTADSPTPTPSATGAATSPTGIAASETGVPSVTPTPTDVVDSTDTPTPISTETPTPIIITFTPTIAPTDTPTVPADLPPLTDDIDPVDQPTTRRISAVDGGRVSSPDGRVTVDFPVGATSEDIDVSITRKQPLSYNRPSPNFPLASVWQLDASAPDRGGAVVHQFAGDVTFTIHFSDRELGGLDPATLQFWTLDETAGTWAGLPSRVNADERIMIVQANHFSIDGATADRLVDNAPLLDGKNTNLHTGSASLDIPISVPPGRGGLAPDLRLTYDSGRIGEMKQYTDVSSWVGMGWELSTGSISFDPPITAGCVQGGGNVCQQGPYRVTLDLGGFGGEMFRDGGAWDAYTLGGSWHVGTNPYLRVEHNCSNIDCPFVITDQHGTKYTFGASDDSKRWLCTDSSYCTQRQYYRFDLETIEDTLANTVDFTYWQQFKWTQCDVYNHGCTPTYVISAYPTVIDYNGGQMRVEFNREYDTGGCIVDVTTGQTVGCLEARSDVVGDFSYQQQCNPWFISYIAPKARESSRLNSIDVKVKDAGGTYQRVRKYQFAYTTEGGDLHDSYPDCGPPEAGVIKLDSIDIRDRNDALTLSHMAFAYTDETFSYKTAIGTSLWTFTRPHLTHAENGFGGAIDFTYATKEKTGTTVDHWTRPVVTSETHSAGLGEPAVATTFTYSNGPDEYPWDNPYRDLMSPYPDYFGAGYRGFQSVTETDSSGNSTGHTFFTTNVGGGWYDEVRSGREISSVVRDGAGNAWQSASTDWVVRPVAAADSGYNYCSNPCNPPFGGPTSTPTTTPTASPVPPQAQQTVMHANFVYAASQTTTQRNGQQTKTVYTYDDGCPATPCYGLLTRVDDVGDPNVTPHNAEVWTNSAWNKDATAWVFTKQYDEKLDPNNGNALLSRTNFYYDGANTRNPSPQPSPVRGLLTAKSMQLNASPGEYSTTYSVYDHWGTSPPSPCQRSSNRMIRRRPVARTTAGFRQLSRPARRRTSRRTTSIRRRRRTPSARRPPTRRTTTSSASRRGSMTRPDSSRRFVTTPSDGSRRPGTTAG